MGEFLISVKASLAALVFALVLTAIGGSWELFPAALLVTPMVAVGINEPEALRSLSVRIKVLHTGLVWALAARLGMWVLS